MLDWEFMVSMNFEKLFWVWAAGMPVGIGATPKAPNGSFRSLTVSLGFM